MKTTKTAAEINAIMQELSEYSAMQDELNTQIESLKDEIKLYMQESGQDELIADNGSKATCTSSSIDVTIYDSEWYVIVKSAGKSENIARGSVTIGKKLLGVTVSQHPVSLTLTCDANGNLS